MAQKKLAWMTLPFGSTPKNSSDVNGWGRHDVKLFAAVKKGDTDKVKSILKKGSVDPTRIESTHGISSLHAAADGGKLEIINLFLTSGVNIETVDVKGKTALHHAADKGKADVTKRLLEAGANVSAVDHDRLSALHHACSSGMIGCLLELLAMPNSPVNARDKDGKSPLSYAAWRGQASLCKLLLEKGAQINSRDNSGCTPLILAGMNGHAELCSFLIAQGADLSLTDINGHSALWHCTNSKRGSYLHAARVIQEAMTGNGHPGAPATPARQHSEREVIERSTTNHDHYESTYDNEEEVKENLYEGINEQQEYIPDYSDDDGESPSSASTAAAAATGPWRDAAATGPWQDAAATGPWQDAAATGPWQDAMYGNDQRTHVVRSDTYLMPSDVHRRSPDEALYADIEYGNEPQADDEEYFGLEATMGEDHEAMLKTNELLEGWRERLEKLEDESRSDSEVDESDVKDPNQLLIGFPEETTDLDTGSISTAAEVASPARPPLSPGDAFFDNLMATIVQRDQPLPPTTQDNQDDLLVQFDVERTETEQSRRLSSNGSSSSVDEMPFDTLDRGNKPNLTETKSDEYHQMQQQQQQQQHLEHKYNSQFEDLAQKMTDAHENNNSLSEQLELSKERTVQANRESDSMKERLESAIGIKSWLHNELKALSNSIESSENRLMQTYGQDGDRDKLETILSDMEGFKQHIDYMLETSKVDDHHHSIDLDASTQKTIFKMMEIKLDRLMKENAELRAAKAKDEQPRKAADDSRYDDFEKRMAHEYQKLDEEIEFKDADEMIAYIKDSIAEISRLREQNVTMSTRLQNLDDLGITDQRNLFNELERTQALNKNLLDKIMSLQHSLEEEKGKGFSEPADVVQGYGEVAVQRDIFTREYENLKLILQKKISQHHASDEELRELDEMQKKQKELLLLVVRIQETGQQMEKELQLKQKQITDLEEQLEDYGPIASERDRLRRDLHALSTMKAEFEENNKELNELRRINLDLGETKNELLETIGRRDSVCDEKENQIADLSRQLQDLGKLAAEKDSIIRELETLRSHADERTTVETSTVSESHSAPHESVSAHEFKQIKQKLEELRDELEDKNDELQGAKARNNELSELLIEYKKADDEKLERIEELSEKVKEFQLLLDIKTEEHKTQIRIAEGEHRKALETLFHKNEELKHDLEETRERNGGVERLKADIRRYEDTLHLKNADIEQLSAKIAMLEREALKRSEIDDDDNHRIREEHRMMAREILELKHALESSRLVHVSKDSEISVVKSVNDDLFMAPPPLPPTLPPPLPPTLPPTSPPLPPTLPPTSPPTSPPPSLATDATIEEIRRLTTENAHLQERVVDLEKAFLKRISTDSSLEHVDRTDGSAVDGRQKTFQIMDDKYMDNPWMDLENFSSTGPLDAASSRRETTGLESHGDAPIEAWNDVLAENRKLKSEVVNARKKMEAELADAELRNVALKDNNRYLQQEVHGLKRTVNELTGHVSEPDRAEWSPVLRSDAGLLRQSSSLEHKSSFTSQMATGNTAEDTLDKLKELERLDRENAELRKVIEDRRRQDGGVIVYQSPVDENQIRKILELESVNVNLSADNDKLKSDVKRLQTMVKMYSRKTVAEDNHHSTSDESDDEPIVSLVEISDLRSDSSNTRTKASKQQESYGKLAVERDILLNEVNALKKLLNNQTLTEYGHEKRENDSYYLSNEKENSGTELRETMSNYGKLATEKDILENEVKRLKKLLDDITSAQPVEHRRHDANVDKQKDDELNQMKKVVETLGLIATERDVLEKEVGHLKYLLTQLRESNTASEPLSIPATWVETKKDNNLIDWNIIEQQGENNEDLGKIATERDILANENKALKNLLKELQTSEKSIRQIPKLVNVTEKSDYNSNDDNHEDNEFGKLAVERDILANEVKHLKSLLEEMKASEKSVKQIHHETIRAERKNEDSDDSDDENPRKIDIGKIAVERDVLIAENKALKKLLEEFQSSDSHVKHITVQSSKATTSNGDSDNEQRLHDDYGKIAVERDVLANEVKHLKALLDEIKTSEKSVKQIHLETTKTERRNEDSDDSDDENPRERDLGKIAVERDVLIAENKALKKLLEESKSSDSHVKHITIQSNKTGNNTDDSDNEQRLNDDYGRLAVERDVLANEVKHLKALLDEIRASEKSVKQIHQESIKIERRNTDSDDSEDENPRERDLGKIAVERDVLIAENKALKKLLEGYQSTDSHVKHITVQSSKAIKSDDDSDNEQRLNDDYGRLAVEKDVLANEVKHLKALLDEIKTSEKSVMQIHQETFRAERRNEDSDDSDDENPREKDLGKIAVERDVLIVENKALKKLLEEFQSSDSHEKHITVQSSKAIKNNDDSDNEQRLSDDYGRIAVERDVLANEVKHLKALLEEIKSSEKSVKQIHHETIRVQRKNEDSDDSDDENPREKDLGKIAVERDVLIAENKALKKLLEESKSSDSHVKHITVQSSKAIKSNDDSDNEQRLNDDYGRLAVERDVLANEVKHLKALMEEMRASEKSVKQIHQETIMTGRRNTDSDDSDDENPREKDLGKIAVERDVLIAENKALKKLLEEFQSSDSHEKHITVQFSKAIKNNDDSDNEQRLSDDYGRIAVERDVLANEVKHLKALLEEIKSSEKSVKQIHHETIRVQRKNEDSDDSDDENPREKDLGKIAVERDVLIAENKALKKLLEESKSSDSHVKHITVQSSKAIKSNDDSDNEQRLNDDYGRLAVERDVLANEVKHLKALMEEMRASEKSVKQIHQETIMTGRRNTDSDDSDDENPREKDLGKIAVERDVLIAENKALKKLLEEFQSSDSHEKHITVQFSKAIKNNDDSDNEQRLSDDYGRSAVERDVLANEVKHLKALLEEIKSSEKSVKQIHHETIRVQRKNEDSDDSDDENPRERDLGKIAVERDVLIAEYKALKKLLEESKSSDSHVKHITVQSSKAIKSNDDSDNEQRLNDDYGRLAVERDVLANEVKHLKALLDEIRASEKSVKQIHQESIKIERRNTDSDDSEDENPRERDLGKIAVERDVLIAENKALKKLLEESKSSDSHVKHITVQSSKAIKSNDDSDNEQRLNDDYGRLAVERDVLANEVKHLKAILEEIRASEKSVKQIHQETIMTGRRNTDSDDSDDENSRERDLGKIAVERDVLIAENKALKKLLEESKSSDSHVKHITIQSNKTGNNTDDSDNEQRLNDDYGRLAVERDVLANEVKHLKALLDEIRASEKSVKQIHQESIKIERRNTDSDDSEDENPRERDLGKIAVERDVLIAENKALKKLLEETHSSESRVKHITVQSSKATTSNDYSDNDQRLNDDYGRLAVERDVLANEVKHLKAILEEIRASEKSIKQIHQETIKTERKNEHSDDSDDENPRERDLGKIAVERDVLIAENKALKKLLEESKLTESHVKHITVQSNKTGKSNDDSDNEQRLNDDYGRLAVERDVLANEVKHLKVLMEEMRASEKSVKHIHQETIRAERRNEESDDSDDENSRERDLGKIAVERDVLIAENKALKKLLEESKSSDSHVKHITVQSSKATTSNDYSDNEQRLIDDYGRLAVERDVLANEVKHLKVLMEEMRASEKSVKQIHQETIRAERRNEDSDDSHDENPREIDIGKIAVERDVLIAENKTLKKLLEEFQSSDSHVKHITVQSSKVIKSNDDSDNEQRLNDDYGRLAVERDVLANEVKHLKALLDEIRASEKSVKHIHQTMIKTERKNTDSDGSDDENPRERDLGKIAVERDVLIAENKALKKLLEKSHSSDSHVKHITVQSSKSLKSNGDSDNEQRVNDDYGKIAVERDVLANEVKHLKALLDEIKTSEKSVMQIHQIAINTVRRNEDSDDSDDENPRERDLGKIAVERDVLIAENKALKKLLEESHSSVSHVKHITVQSNKTGKSNDDSENEQRLTDDYGRLAVERDVLANEVKHLKALLDEIKASEKSVKHIHHKTIRTKKRNQDSDDSDYGTSGRSALQRNALASDDEPIKDLFGDLQSSHRSVVHIRGDDSRDENVSDNEKRLAADYGRLAVERDILANEVKYLKRLLDDKAIHGIDNEAIHSGASKAGELINISGEFYSELLGDGDIGKIAIERDILVKENKMLKKLLADLQAYNKSSEVRLHSTLSEDVSDDLIDGISSRDSGDDKQVDSMNMVVKDFGKLAVQHEILERENQNLKKLLKELEVVGQNSHGNENHSSESSKLTAERDALLLEVRNFKILLEDASNSSTNIRELTELKKKLEDLDKVATERDILKEELESLKRVLNTSAAQQGSNTAYESKRTSVLTLGAAEQSTKSQEPVDLVRRLLEMEEANHRLERSVSENKEIVEKQSLIIQKKEEKIRSFNDKQKILSGMELQIEKLKEENLKLSEAVAEQKGIAERQSETIKKKERRIAEINVFAHDYDKLSLEKDILCREVKDLKLLLEKQKGILPENGHLESNTSHTVTTSKPSLDSKHLAENDTKALLTELEQAKRSRSELLTEVSTLRETLRNQDKTILELQKKEHNYENVIVEINTLRRDLDIAQEQLRTTHRSSDLVDIGRRDEQLLLKSRPGRGVPDSALSSDDEESQVALNALRRKIAEKEKLINSMDSVDEEKQFLEEEVEELREKLRRQETIAVSTRTPVKVEDDLVMEVKKLRQDLEDKEREIERLRNAELDEHRQLQKQIEHLKQKVVEHPSHLTAEYEASLRTTISDLEEQKYKLQNELGHNLQDRELEIERIRKAELDERRKLQIEIERLKHEVNAHPSHFTAEHEASLLAAISDLDEQKKKLQNELRQNLEDHEHEIERLRNAEEGERRELQVQIERLKNAIAERPSHLTADYEGDLMIKIADLEQEKKKLQSTMHEKEARDEQEIKELTASNDELMDRLTKAKKEAQKQYAELTEDNEGHLESIGLLQKQCAEFADEQEELLERDRLMQIEVKKLKEELQTAENKWINDKEKLDDENKRIREQLQQQKRNSAKEVEDLQNYIASLLENVNSATKEKGETVILTKHTREFGNTQVDEIARKDKEIAELATKLKHHVTVLAERDILNEKVERLEDLLRKRDETSEKVERDMTIVLGRPMVDAQPPETVPDLREQEIAALRLNIEQLTKQNKELRRKIDDLEFNLTEEKEKFERNILELKWTLTKSEDECNSRKTENKELREKVEDFERTTVVEKSSTVVSESFKDVKKSQQEENDRLKDDILELRFKLARSEELRSHRDLSSDERHTHLETLVQSLERENSALKLKVSKLETELKLLPERKRETVESINVSQTHQNHEYQPKLRSRNDEEYDASYVRQIEDEVELLREVNRALSKDIADLQYRLTEKLVLMRSSDGMSVSDSDRDYLHKKMKDFTQQSLRYLSEIQDLEEKNRRSRHEAKTLRQENDELRDEVDTLHEIYNLHNTSPKDLVSRLRSENGKLQQFIKILEDHMFKKVSPSQSSEQPLLDVKSISADSFGLFSLRQSDDLMSEGDASLSSSQRMLFADTLDECHQEIQRLRQINKDLEKRYKEIVSTYRSHLLASIQGRLDPEVKDALVRILRMKPVEYSVR